MKIAFNPSTVAALITPPNNKDITFDLRGRNIFARGVKFCGTDTNTWRDIKINNVSIGSNTLDLRNGSNTTLTNTNGVVTINSTWRPVVDNLTSDSTTSSLSAKQGKVLKSLIDGKSDSGHTHDDRYLKLTGGTMASNALITFADSGSWGTDKGPQGARGGLYWTGQSDYAKLYAEETVGDNLDLVIQFGDDNSNGLSIRNKANTQTSYISAGGVITTGTFKGNLDWSYITNKPSSYTPSAHTHAWNSLTHSSTTENQAILTNGKANGWKLYTLNISRWNNAANNAHSHSNKSVLDGITSALVNNWNIAYTFVNTITGTDTDKVINKWDEIVNFLAGITEDNKLNTLLNSKLSVYELANNTNVGAIKNNGIYYSTTDASSGTLTNSPFNTGFALINMTSYDGGDDLRRSRLAFNAYGEIKVSNDRDYANTAETWYNVLTSKNSGINGSTIKLNGTSITVYSSSTADGRYVKKSGDTMSGVLTIDTTNFGALIIKRNDDANGASIQFRGKSSVYGYIGLNNSTKDKLFLRFSSDTSKIYTILDTSSTYTSNGKGVINGTTITRVDNATNSTNSTNARKLVNWYSTRPTSLNAQFGDGSLKIFYATSSTTEGKPTEDSHILHLAWDNNGGWDAQLAVHTRSGKVSTRAQNSGTWQPWKTLAFTTDIPSSLKNPYSFNVFGVTYDGSAAKTVTTSTFISLVTEGTSTITDGTMFITSYASNSGFADTNAVNVPYKRKAIHLWEYIKMKTDSLYTTKSHNHDDRYVRAFGTSNDNIDSDWGLSFKTFDPIPSGTPPEKNPNISILNIGNNFNRRKLLAFIYSNDNIYYRRHTEGGFSNWRRIAFANEIPTSLKNPYALTISLNGTSQGPYDGSATKNINITPGSIGAAVSNHSHDYLVVNAADDKSFNSAYHNFLVLYAGGGNGITGKPANVDAFGLFKFRTASGWSGQMLLSNVGSLYIRSSEDAKITNTLAWKTILDSSNYSGILDSRYYTESEVNNLLSRKLDRVNLTTGSWNPRGYNLAADYSYNGGDLSISESGGKIHVSVDGYFWLNEGQYRVLDTSDVAGLKNNLTVHLYLSNTDTTWWPLIWGGSSHNNTSDSTGTVYKSYDKLSWLTSSLTLYATRLQTTDITFPNSGTSMRGIQGTVGDNDFWRIKGGATASNSGYLEIATADDGNEPIYVRQYTGVFSSIKRTLTLLDTNGFTHFPSYINIGGNENNNSSPDRVWGSNGSDSYLRSYRTSALRVAYAVNANSATTASSANKLTTARNIALGTDLRGSANFDGSSNITINANINACTVQVGSTDALHFKRIAHFETGGSWNDNALLLYISLGYINGSNGICRVEFRTDNISSSSTSVTASAAVRWLVRNGYGLDSLYAGYYVTTSKAYIDIYLKTTGSYQGTVIRVLLDSRGGINSNVLLINSYYYSDTNHKEAYNSIEAASTALYNRAYTRIVSGSDVGTVSHSNSTGSVHWNNVTNKPSTFAPAAHTHTVFNNNLMIKGTNGISNSASIHLGIGDSDTGFKWISDGKCLIYANNAAVGEWTSGGMNWFKNPTVNGNKVWNAGNDGSGSGLDADLLDGYHASSFSLARHTHLYVATTSFNGLAEGTVATYKNNIHNTLSDMTGIGKHIVVSDSIINNWSNNSASFSPSSVSSIISINGGYNGNSYGQFLVSSWNLGLGLLIYNKGSFQNIKWFSTTDHTHLYLPLSGGTMSNTNKVTNLNADLLDGVHLNGIFTAFLANGNATRLVIGGVTKDLTISYASKAGSVAWDSITGKPSSFTPSSHTHSWTSITDKLVAGNEFNIVNAGFNEGMWFNYVPINDRSKTATITGYHFGNGATGYTSINASGFIKKGSNSNYVLLGDGGHKLESSLNVANADKVDGYHASGLWRSDGATWNPNANVSLNANANSQEWSFDIRRNGYTGCYWHVWDSSLNSMLKVNADNGKVYAPYNFVGNLEGNASTATTLTTNAGNSINPIYFSGGKPVACTMSTGRGDGIVRSFSRGAYTSANLYFGNGTIVTIDPKGTGCISANDTILSLGDLSIRNTQLLVAYDRDGVYYRRITDGLSYGDWKRLAFTTDNVASATKLQTARSIWGHSFNGTADVNGTIYINNNNSGEGAIRLNNNINSNARISAINDQVIFNTGAAIRFGGTSWDWNVWAGLKYTHSNKTIYLGIADNSIFNANSALSGGSLRFPGISNVYATTFNGNLSGNASTATNADKLDGTHLNGIFTAFGNNAHNITATIGGVTKSFLVNWAADSDKLDGYHENSFLRYRGDTSTDLEATLWNLIGIKLYNNALPDNLTGVYNYGSVISLPGSSSRFEIYASHLSSNGNGLYYRSGWGSDKKTWLKFIDSSNIGSQSVNYANSAGNADKLDGIHANGLLTALSNSNNGISITVGGTTKSVSNISVNYASSAGNADTATNTYHLRINAADTWSTWYWVGLSGLPSWLWGSNDGTNMYVWDPNNFNVHTALYLRSLGNLNCQTGRTLNYGDVYTYNTYDGNTGSPTTFTSVIGFGRGIAGTVEIAGGWDNTNLYWRSLRDCCEDWHSWRTVLDSSNYTLYINNYYWANVKISTTSSTTTSPTVHTLTATRVCAGHNPEIDNSISCSNWFRSSGDTGWYNTTYRGGWYMSDTSWIRAHNGVGIYTSGQIYSSSSIRMGNIYLLNTNEINSTSGIHLNYQNSGNITLCYGGGNVGIGTSPLYKLDVNGNIHSSGTINCNALNVGSTLSIKNSVISCSASDISIESKESGSLLVNSREVLSYNSDRISMTNKTQFVHRLGLGASSPNPITNIRTTDDVTVYIGSLTESSFFEFRPAMDGLLLFLKIGKLHSNTYFWCTARNCEVIKANNFSTHLNRDQNKDCFGDGYARIFIYKLITERWYEFYCG